MLRYTLCTSYKLLDIFLLLVCCIHNTCRIYHYLHSYGALISNQATYERTKILSRFSELNILFNSKISIILFCE